jgi:hypothetical protein
LTNYVTFSSCADNEKENKHFWLEVSVTQGTTAGAAEKLVEKMHEHESKCFLAERGS